MTRLSMKELRMKAKAFNITNWQKMKREDLEFWVREWESLDLDKLHTTVTATEQG